jgi:hypothetical protein
MKTKLLAICLLLVTSQVFAKDCKGKYWNNCYGTYTWANGNKYVGEWKTGSVHGQGTMTFADGSKYVGEWKKGSKEGKGTETFADGSKYVGEYYYGLMHGQGTYTRANGNKYVGEWRSGKRNGHGIETFADGSKYVGEWVEDKRRKNSESFYEAKEEQINKNLFLNCSDMGSYYFPDYNQSKKKGYGNGEYYIPNADKMSNRIIDFSIDITRDEILWRIKLPPNSLIPLMITNFRLDRETLWLYSSTKTVADPHTAQKDQVKCKIESQDAREKIIKQIESNDSPNNKINYIKRQNKSINNIPKEL